METFSWCAIIFVIFFGWIAPIIIAVKYASKHNLSTGGWGFLAFCLGWIGVLIELIIGYSVSENKN